MKTPASLLSPFTNPNRFNYSMAQQVQKQRVENRMLGSFHHQRGESWKIKFLDSLASLHAPFFGRDEMKDQNRKTLEEYPVQIL